MLTVEELSVLLLVNVTQHIVESVVFGESMAGRREASVVTVTHGTKNNNRRSRRPYSFPRSVGSDHHQADSV